MVCRHVRREIQTKKRERGSEEEEERAGNELV
jgi:hypothetical protein